MAQPNVAREPSMEEILASIRRIIESNEPQADNALQADQSADYDLDEDEDDIEIVAEMAANDPGPARFVQPVQVAASENTQERSLSLADVAARVRAASARQVENGTVRLPTPPAGFAEAIAPHVEPKAPVAVPVEPVALRPRADDISENVTMEKAPVAAENASPQVALQPEPQRAPRIEPALETAAPFAEPASLPAKIEAAAALMSDEAGAHVARSFGELSAVFDGIANRSIEDMTQEMLRPMLQEWLDDNLPTLVERLVREEIERVARGPRR
jgi:cell pole-organizing protein PopZ